MGTNLGDAVAWLLLVVPFVLVPIGIVAAAPVAGLVRAVERASDRRRVAAA